MLLSEAVSASNTIISIVKEIRLLLNGRDSDRKPAYFGPQFFKRHRYLLLLWLATVADIFRTHGKEIEDSAYFTYYRLSKIASGLSVDFDRSKVAMNLFRDFEKKGLVKIVKKQGETFIAITEKGTEKSRQFLMDLIALQPVSTDPSLIYEYNPEMRQRRERSLEKIKQRSEKGQIIILGQKVASLFAEPTTGYDIGTKLIKRLSSWD